jgi:hypothetical protein
MPSSKKHLYVSAFNENLRSFLKINAPKRFWGMVWGGAAMPLPPALTVSKSGRVGSAI